ncbi:hypothetical protein PT2222_430024 [Paraburkholderia tropica]
MKSRRGRSACARCTRISRRAALRPRTDFVVGIAENAARIFSAWRFLGIVVLAPASGAQNTQRIRDGGGAQGRAAASSQGVADDEVFESGRAVAGPAHVGLGNPSCRAAGGRARRGRDHSERRRS